MNLHNEKLGKKKKNQPQDYPQNLLVMFQGLDHMLYVDPSIMKHIINIGMA